MDRTPTEWMIEPLRRYAQFSGRARRAEYWWFALFALVVHLIASGIDYALGLATVGLGTVASLALVVPQAAVGFRRIHDTDRSGWWVGAGLIAGIPLGLAYGFAAMAVATGAGGTGLIGLLGAFALIVGIYGIVMLVWFCQRGTVGPNRFGPDPLAAVAF